MSTERSSGGGGRVEGEGERERFVGRRWWSSRSICRCRSGAVIRGRTGEAEEFHLLGPLLIPDLVPSTRITGLNERSSLV